MKPKMNDKKCGASKNGCKAIKACPVGAMGYIEVNEPITDRTVNCVKHDDDGTESVCGCGCSDDCGGSEYGRIVIDYDICTGCGLCADECCAEAIEMID